jgi:FAD/FMN-containing dehydrogenase
VSGIVRSIEGFSGAVIAPGDDAYDDARKLWNAMIDRRPALITRPLSTADVAAAIRHARKHSLKIAVRGGSHSVPGYSMCDDGLVIDLSGMHGVRVSPKDRRAWAQGGCLLRHLDEATLAHGLVAPAGAISHTGVAGLTLGGGFGHLMRRFGLTIDNLRSVELVTAEGEVLRVRDDSHPELFWALRGGGGNFGVATEFEFDLHPLREVYVALAIHRLDRAEHALQRWQSAMNGAPDDFFWPMFFRIMPPLPWVPKELAGQPVALSSIEWCGDMAEGERYVRAILDDIKPEAHVALRMPFLEVQSMLDDICAHGVRSYCKAGFIRDIDAATLDVLVEHGKRSTSWRSQLEVLPMGGAIDRIANGATAFPHRGNKWVFNVVAMWDSAADDARNIAWVRDAYRGLEPHMTGGAYVNYMGGEEAGGLNAAYGAGPTLQRLQTIKAKYDPENLFCFNQNLKPQGVRAA